MYVDFHVQSWNTPSLRRAEVVCVRDLFADTQFGGTRETAKGNSEKRLSRFFVKLGRRHFPFCITGIRR